LSCHPVVADPRDDSLHRLHLKRAVHLLPHGGIGDSTLRFPDLQENRLLDSVRGKGFRGTHCPAPALRVEAHIVGIPAGV
jgi:hypothetical protein